MKNATSIGMIMLCAALGGCSSTPDRPAHWSDQSRYSQLDLETTRMLKSIQESLLVLAETRDGKVAMKATPEEMAEREWLYRVTPPGMGVPMTINSFRGHPEVAINMVAGTTGYHIESIGKPSPDVRNVTVNQLSRPAVEILRSVAAQMACDGLVDVQGASKKIVLDWTIRRRGECK